VTSDRSMDKGSRVETIHLVLYLGKWSGRKRNGVRLQVGAGDFRLLH